MTAATNRLCIRSAGPRRAGPLRDRISVLCRNFEQDEAGASAVEFALVAPLLIGVTLSALIFSLVLNNFILVTNASLAGAGNLILSRGSSTPYTETVAAIGGAAQGLASANLTIAVSVDGTTCLDDSSCETALTSATGKPASVTVSYPCSLKVLQIDYAPSGCVLQKTTTGRVQ